MTVFSTPLVYCCPSTFSLISPSHPAQSKCTLYPNSVWLWGVGLVLSCVVDHILKKFTTLFLTRFRTYKIPATYCLSFLCQFFLPSTFHTSLPLLSFSASSPSPLSTSYPPSTLYCFLSCNLALRSFFSLLFLNC